MTVTYLDEAYQRLHRTGPEFEGWLSNHGPMAAEAMVRHGHGEQVSHWLDHYVTRLEEFPGGSGPIGPDWRTALGDPRRIADWTDYFLHQTAEHPWPDVLGTWWQRLLPGSAASATHGIIRVGHSVRTLLGDGEDPVRVAELAHALAYWAARWQPFPGNRTRGPVAGATLRAPGAALAAVPRITDQTGGYRSRLPRLIGLTGWPAVASEQDPSRAKQWLTDLVNAAVLGFLDYAYGNATMLVHSATAPNAILRTLPALDESLWAPSAAAAWAAAAALTAIYAPAEAAPPRPWPATSGGAEDVFARAVEHGDEHAIKFADTAVEVHARTGDPAALAAAVHAAALIPVPLRRDEVVARVEQTRDDDAQGGHRFRTVTPAVMLKDDRAALRGAHDVVHDVGHARARPVPRVDGPVDRRHSHVRAVPEHGGRPDAVGGAESGGHDAGRAVDRVGGPIHLGLHRRRCEQAEVQVPPGVVGDLVAGVRHLAGHFREPLDLETDHREHGGHPVLGQQLEHLRGVDRVRAVVDGQRDRLGPVLDVEHRLVGDGSPVNG
jgi:hypothetical protein